MSTGLNLGLWQKGRYATTSRNNTQENVTPQAMCESPYVDVLTIQPLSPAASMTTMSSLRVTTITKVLFSGSS